MMTTLRKVKRVRLERLFAVLAGGALLACVGQRVNAGALVPVNVEAGADVLTKYVWRGQLLTDDPVVQPSLTLSWKGLSLNVWGSVDPTDIHEESGDEWRIQEIDWTLSYAFSPAEWLDAEAGVIAYTFPGTGVYTTEEVYGSVTLPTVPLSPTLTVYYDVDEVDGFYVNFSVSRSFDVAKRVSLTLGGSIGWGDSDYDKAYFGEDYSSIGDASVSASLEYAVTENASVALTAAYIGFPDGDIREAADAGYGDASNLVVGLSFALGF